MISRVLITAFLILSGIDCAAAQTSTDGISGERHFRLRYVINIEKLDSTFLDNSERMVTIEDFLTEVRDDSLLNITGVDFRGTASPDGAYDFNVWLSENRLRTFKELINSYVVIPDSIINAQTSAIPWDEFRDKVVESDVPHKEEVLAIIDEGPSLVPYFNNRRIDPRLLKLKSMYRGKVWDYLKSPILRDLRYGDAVFHYQYLLPPFGAPALNLQASLPLPDLLPLPSVVKYESWVPRVYIKTNAVAWGFAIANLGLEIDMAPHWSFSFPIYYSIWDYFKSTIKFRMLTYQPEFRYWFRNPWGWGGNDGFYIGPHFMLSYYNFAFDGAHRYQDHDANTPAIGGGLSVGFRMPISKNKRWRVEFSAGAGIYPLDYDIFQNTPNYKDGQLVGRTKKTYIGLDQVSVTFSYSFDLKKCTKYRPLKGGAL